MNKEEYERISNLKYREYCEYLKGKYGQATCDYMVGNYSKNPMNSRTAEGLFAHHVYEDQAIMLSEKEHAMRHPFEWQKAENIVYADYLEHLLLHILICEIPLKEKPPFSDVGVGGIISYIVPELNDYYSGFVAKTEWRNICFNKVKNDKDVYLILIKRFKSIKESLPRRPEYYEEKLYRSASAKYGSWPECKNADLYLEIEAL